MYTHFWCWGRFLRFNPSVSRRKGCDALSTLFLHLSQRSRRPPSSWQCPPQHWPTHSPKHAAQAAWRGARATTPPESSIGKRGSGGSAGTTWNTAPSFWRSSLARRWSTGTWGLRWTPTTSTLAFGWVRTNEPYKMLSRNITGKTPPTFFSWWGCHPRHAENITSTRATLCSISWPAIFTRQLYIWHTPAPSQDGELQSSPA